MKQKVFADAFDLYVSLGPQRSYSLVAKQIGVNRRTVVRRALAEKWQERLIELETKARLQSESKAVESLSSVNDKHLRIVRFVQGRALEALKSIPIKTAADALKALEFSVRLERELLHIAERPAGEEARPPSISFLRKLYDECPTWQVNILACTFQRGDEDPRSSRTITNLLLDLFRWLQDVATRKALDASLPLTGMIESALRCEDDPLKYAEMRAKIVRISEELVRYRAERPGVAMITGGDSDGPLNGEGSQRGLEEPGSDPISVVARSLRLAPVPTEAAAIVVGDGGGESHGT